jgi:hypothetical protein
MIAHGSSRITHPVASVGSIGRDDSSLTHCQNTVLRGVKAATSGHDAIVKKYIKTFKQLKTKYRDDASVNVEITVYRTLSLVQETRKRPVL